MASEQSYIVVGLGLGDESKGAAVDFLSRKHGIKKVVRHNGGSQCGHNVETPEGVRHCFAQVGSASLASHDTETHLSRFMAVDPIALVNEVLVLKDKGLRGLVKRIFIDSRCPVISDLNILLNRMSEMARGDARHGSCGKGVGVTLRDRDKYGSEVLLAGDLSDPNVTEYKLAILKTVRVRQAEEILATSSGNKAELERYLQLIRGVNLSDYVRYYEKFSRGFNIIKSREFIHRLGDSSLLFEGAQGALLDTDHGFLPHVTWSKTTTGQADELVNTIGLANVKRVGVLRGYTTRHGAGPFPTEDPELSELIPPCDNKENEWQGRFRLGWFDLVAAKYGTMVNGGIDELAISNLDRMNGLKDVKVYTSYLYEGVDYSTLEKYFRFERLPDDKFLISGLKASRSDVSHDDRLAIGRVVGECKPGEFISFEGWQIDRGVVGKYSHLPASLRGYLNFLSERLDLPINTVSIGPTWRDRIECR